MRESAAADVGGAGRTSTSDRVLLDTNVLVYAEDAGEPSKGAIARAVLGTLVDAEAAVVTPQVLGEYFYTITRLFAVSLGADGARARIDEYAELLPVLPATLTLVLEAVRGTIRYRMHYYDAQIWAAARLHGVPVVLSEDFEDGREIEGVRFFNPFAPGFDLQRVFAKG